MKLLAFFAIEAVCTTAVAEAPWIKTKAKGLGHSISSFFDGKSSHERVTPAETDTSEALKRVLEQIHYKDFTPSGLTDEEKVTFQNPMMAQAEALKRVLGPLSQPDARVLVIGPRAGYITACIAALMGPEAMVLALAKEGPLVLPQKYKYLNDRIIVLDDVDYSTFLSQRLVYCQHDAICGKHFSTKVRFDVIFATGQSAMIPMALKDRLTENGMFILPMTPPKRSPPSKLRSEVVKEFDAPEPRSRSHAEHGAPKETKFEQEAFKQHNPSVIYLFAADDELSTNTVCNALDMPELYVEHKEPEAITEESSEQST